MGMSLVRVEATMLNTVQNGGGSEGNLCDECM